MQASKVLLRRRDPPKCWSSLPSFPLRIARRPREAWPGEGVPRCSVEMATPRVSPDFASVGANSATCDNGCPLGLQGRWASGTEAGHRSEAAWPDTANRLSVGFAERTSGGFRTRPISPFGHGAAKERQLAPVGRRACVTGFSISARRNLTSRAIRFTYTSLSGRETVPISRSFAKMSGATTRTTDDKLCAP